MENQVTIFNNPQFGSFRTAGNSDNPLFCAVDVARALGYANPAKAVIDHCKGVTILETPTAGGVQAMKYIPEPDVYRLIFKSNAPNAEKFNTYFAEEVLPTIRKHGMYATAEKIEQMLQDPENMIKVLTTLKEEREQRIAAEAKATQLQAINDEQRPKVVFADAVIGSEGSCLIGELAKILAQNGIKIGANRLFDWLRENHYLGTSGEYYNIPNQRYVEQGLFELKKNTYSVNGTMQTRTTPKVTTKGQQYFINKFLNI